MAQTKGESVRQKIVQKSIELFSRKGFAESSLREIAELCGMKQPAILHHFPNKYALFGACVEEIFRHFEGVNSRLSSVHDSALDRLKKSFKANLIWLDEHPEDNSIILFLYYTATHDAHYRKLYTDLLRRIRERYEGILLAGIREKVLRFEGEASLVAEVVHEELLGQLINYISSENRKKEVSLMEKKWDLFIQNMFKL